MSIKSYFKNRIRQFLLDRNIYLTKFDSSIFYNSFISLTLAKHKLLYGKKSKLENDFLNFCISNYNQSYSQRGQDLFCLYVFSKTKNANKLCIEFGAGDGKLISNTFLLSQKNFLTILIEPSKYFFKSLKKNRPNDISINGCIKSIKTQEEKSLLYDAGHYSSINENYDDPEIGKFFKENLMGKYYVKNYDLNNLIDKYFPGKRHINYLSIDIEGDELGVLESINFSKYEFDCLTVECAIDNKNRNKIIEFLKSNGYEAIFSDSIAITGVDIWFVNSKIKLL